MVQSVISIRKQKMKYSIISPENLLKFFVKKNTNRDSLSFQLTSISGNLPTLTDRKEL